MTQNISLDLITYNSFQSRVEYGDVEALALSIATDDIKESPQARRQGDSYELVFGHRRYEAFRWLNANWQERGLADRYQGYTMMPLEVRELTDEEMFRGAAIENALRKNLSVVEQIEEMKLAQEKFGYTSVQLGQLYGKPDSSIRAILYLDQADETVKAKLAADEITIGAARISIPVARMAPERLAEYLNDVAGGENPEEAGSSALRRGLHTTIIGVAGSSGHFDIKQKSFAYLADLGEETIAASLAHEDEETDGDAVTMALLAMLEKKPTPTTELERRALHLLKPPACTACDYFATMDGTHYCAIKECFNRKKAAAAQEAVVSKSKQVGIPLYQSADGKYSNLNRWEDSHVKYVARRHEDLRLLPTERQYGNFDGLSDRVQVVAVGKLHEKLKKAEDKDNRDRGQLPNGASDEEKRARKRAILLESVTVDELEAFEWGATEFFVPLMEGVKNAVFLERLYGSMNDLSVYEDSLSAGEKNKMTKPARLKLYQRAILQSIFTNMIGWNMGTEAAKSKTPAAQMAKFYRSKAEEWGVKLGKGFDAFVEAEEERIAEARRVAVETEQGK